MSSDSPRSDPSRFAPPRSASSRSDLSGRPVSRRDLIRRGGALTALAAAGSALAGPALARSAAAVPPGREDADAARALATLESRHDARLGVYAVNHGNGRVVSHRSAERFAFCSAYKAPLAAHVLAQAGDRPEALNALVRYDKRQLVDGDFVTGLYLDTGMTVRGLCAAACGQSDNVAANLLLERTGGPAGLTRFIRAHHDTVTRSDRSEPSVNSAIPGDPRDTTTPQAFAGLLSRLLLGDGLSAPARQQLRYWLQGDTTNINRFRAGLPLGWTLADKTGTGDYGVANDAGVVWTQRGTPLTIAVFTHRSGVHDEPDEALVAGAARIVARALAPQG